MNSSQSADDSKEIKRLSTSDSDNDISIEQNSSFNTSIESAENNMPTPAKRVKLTETDKKLLAAEREKIRKEREQLKEIQQRTKLERELSKIERERERIEKARQKQIAKEEKEQKQKEVQEQKVQQEKEKNRLKKEEKQRKEAEREEKARLKEEKEQKQKELQKHKEEERLKKENEKREKDAERQRQNELKELEKQKKSEEKQAAEDAKRKAEEKEKLKLEKSKSLMFNFLKKGLKPVSANESDQNKDDINENLACFDERNFTLQLYKDIPKEDLYLGQLCSGKIIPKFKRIKDDKTSEDDDVIMIENDLPEGVKPKPFIFLQFCENIRPAYFGPMPRNPVRITGKRPFEKEEFLDYDYESDLEWDEGGPGESLSDSDSDGEEKDDYEMDEFFVPHGYLSDDEIKSQVDFDEENQNDDRSSVNETEKSKLKEKLQLKDKARLAEMNTKYQKPIQPQFISCLWQNTDEAKKEKEKFDFLKMFSITPIVYTVPMTSV